MGCNSSNIRIIKITISHKTIHRFNKKRKLSKSLGRFPTVLRGFWRELEGKIIHFLHSGDSDSVLSILAMCDPYKVVPPATIAFSWCVYNSNFTMVYGTQITN